MGNIEITLFYSQKSLFFGLKSIYMHNTREGHKREPFMTYIMLNRFLLNRIFDLSCTRCFLGVPRVAQSPRVARCFLFFCCFFCLFFVVFSRIISYPEGRILGGILQYLVPENVYVQVFIPHDNYSWITIFKTPKLLIL